MSVMAMLRQREYQRNFVNGHFIRRAGQSGGTVGGLNNEARYGYKEAGGWSGRLHV
jgi:hypothetical protein